METGQVDVNIEIQSEALKSQQNAEKSSKIETIDQKEP